MTNDNQQRHYLESFKITYLSDCRITFLLADLSCVSVVISFRRDYFSVWFCSTERSWCSFRFFNYNYTSRVGFYSPPESFLNLADSDISNPSKCESSKVRINKMDKADVAFSMHPLGMNSNPIWQTTKPIFKPIRLIICVISLKITCIFMYLWILFTVNF